MFDRIADRYDLLNRLISMGLDQGWRRRLVAALAPAFADRTSSKVLDLATGTADVALAVARRFAGVRVVGLDPSEAMLRVGAGKVAALAAPVSLVRGDAQRLPFPDDAFDGALISFGIRNVPDRDAALREMARVTRPGGVVAVLELGLPRKGVLAPLARLHTQHVVPRLGGWLSGEEEYRYLAASVAAFPAPEAFLERLEAAGLVDLELRRMGFDAAHLYLGRPR